MLTLAALTTACAADNKPSESAATGDDLSAQVAFYGLTVVDCQQQATQCYKTQKHALNCSTKLARCLSRAGAEAAKGVLEETREVTACGKSGVQCVGDATKLSAVLGCEDKVESCVLGHVTELTGIPLPTSQQAVAEVASTAGQVVETAVEATGEIVETGVRVAGQVVQTGTQVAEHVVETTLDATHQVVDTTVKVGGEVVEHAVEVTGEVLETAHAVTAEVAQTATAVVGDVVQTGLNAGKTALQCGEESRSCIRTTKKLLSCQLAYATCLSNAL
jgi:hypothetical protein